MPTTGGAREGFFASPSPEAWSRMDGTTEGIAATWVDATVVGVPSDFYYLAATGPLFSQLLHSPECRAESSHVLLDNVPTFASGVVGSPGDYMARGEGTCTVKDRRHPLGILRRRPRVRTRPATGDRPVRACMWWSRSCETARRPDRTLQRLIAQTRFGDTPIRDFVDAVRQRAVQTA